MTNSKDIVTTRHTHPYDCEKEEKVGKIQEAHSLLSSSSHDSINAGISANSLPFHKENIHAKCSGLNVQSECYQLVSQSHQILGFVYNFASHNSLCHSNMVTCSLSLPPIKLGSILILSHKHLLIFYLL